MGYKSLSTPSSGCLQQHLSKRVRVKSRLADQGQIPKSWSGNVMAADRGQMGLCQLVSDSTSYYHCHFFPNSSNKFQMMRNTFNCIRIPEHLNNNGNIRITQSPTFGWYGGKPNINNEEKIIIDMKRPSWFQNPNQSRKHKSMNLIGIKPAPFLCSKYYLQRPVTF